MNTCELPDAIEPDYWNVVFHPSESAASRFWLGRFQHVSAFSYVPGFKGWIVYDVQWSGMRIGMLSHQAAIAAFTAASDKCVLVKFNRQHKHLGLLSRLGFYCVPAIKQVLGLSCVAVTPDGLYRHLIANGGIVLNERVDTAAAAARSDAAAGAAAGPG